MRLAMEASTVATPAWSPWPVAPPAYGALPLLPIRCTTSNAVSTAFLEAPHIAAATSSKHPVFPRCRSTSDGTNVKGRWCYPPYAWR
jgi:hypothetical protein